MSLLGIGSARIDLTLPKKSYRAGEYIKGYYLIRGGTIDQKAKRIDCDLVMMEPSMGLEKIISSTTILTSRLIHSGEECKISFTFKIPYSIKASPEGVYFHFKTKLTFNEGVASIDQDIIQVI